MRLRKDLVLVVMLAFACEDKQSTATQTNGEWYVWKHTMGWDCWCLPVAENGSVVHFTERRTRSDKARARRDGTTVVW